MSHKLETGAKITRRPPHPVPDEFLLRLIDFYHRQPEPHISPIWKGVLSQYQRPLIEALQSKSVSRVRVILESLYVGDVMGGLDAAQYPGHCWEKFEQCAIALGNAIGSIPLHSPEQPNALTLNVENLIAGIESVLGFKLTHPGGGQMWGVEVGDRFIPFKLLDVVSAVLSIPDTSWLGQPILEIGSGSAMLAYVSASMSSWILAGYDSIDLPSTSVIGAYLSAGAFSPDLIHLQGEVDLVDPVRFMGAVVPKDGSYGLIFNQDSLPEMPHEVALDYVEMIGRKLLTGGYFLSVNHESCLGGQHRVFDMVRERTKLKQVSRNLVFSRPGYLQEVWVKA